jgi:enoyl-CoA hydratase/carnithine racemase
MTGTPDPAGAGRPGSVHVKVERRDSAATVTIDRPAKHNALTVDMWRTLAGICTELATDPDLRVVVVSGAGPSFCAGADISALSTDDATMKIVVAEAERRLRSIPVPTVAKIRGHCLGGGSQIAVACDLRLCDTSATFGVPPARLSVVYPVSSTRALVELVGPSAAKRLIFTAVPVDAAEALRIGLVDEAVPPGELDGAVDRLLAQLLAAAPLTQAAAKEMINAIADGADAESVHEGWYRRWAASADGTEGPRAFLERRPPVFGWRPAGPG